MMPKILVFAGLLVCIWCGASASTRQGNNTDEEAAQAFLEQYNALYADLANKYIEAGLRLSEYQAVANEEANQFDPTNFTEDTKRQLSYVGSKSLSDDEMKNLSSIIAEMGSIYGQGKVCRLNPSGEEECLSLEPELTLLMADSRNASERLWAWDGWRREVSRKIKPLYFQYVELKNKLAVVNGFNDYGDQLRQKYEDPEFESDIHSLYEEMNPLYLQLHAYVRRKLYETYGPDVINLNGTLPQSVLGDMWGRFWANLYSIGVPFPDQPSLDITQALIDQNYTITRMFETSDDFYTSMGLIPLPPTFYNLSMLEKPSDREVVCHATAWDFYDSVDYRNGLLVRMRDENSHENINLRREGANDGFHEAIGELMSMIVSTPKHLYAIGLLDELPTDNKTEINYLFQQALSTISTLPFHLLQDQWRWNAFRGYYGNMSSQWNGEFWALSEAIVGVHAPVERTEEDLDCPSIFHVAQDYDMIRYFTRTILQFQFAESLCEAAGHEGPLTDCDFYGSQEAGAILS
ncbi:Angiotensin-converting enzyme [Folsomia candida]|uniref:Angiotensin-converting enzyme n=1 Tax=Folsomia candida TaxID=158441 RepID=A0A226EU77_FOLCA|nr:Angiotensin-converting enzyme [Folsomia candida]